MGRKPSQDPAVTRAMDVLFQWNMKVGYNDGRGVYWQRPSPAHIEEMAKELLDAIGIYYDKRG